MSIKSMKEWIDNASYEELLRKWRFAPAGDPFFRSDTKMGAYYSKVMAEKKKHINAAVASKRVGLNP